MLNPDRNLYSVAPVGQVVIIGRNNALKGGLSRENALNLIGWLILATNAKPEDITRVLLDASKPVGAQAPKVEAPKVSVPPVAAFIGEIDPEEQAAIDAVKQPPAAPAVVPLKPAVAAVAAAVPATTPVDEAALTAAWAGKS